MASTKEYLDYIMEQLSDLDEESFKRKKTYIILYDRMVV